MGSLELNFQLILEYFRENGGKVKNRDAVRYFKRYLTDPALKDINRQKFKEYINTVAHTKQEGDEKVLLLKTKYLSYNSLDVQSSPLSTSTISLNSLSAQSDPRNNIGLPLSPINTSYGSTTSLNTPTRQPPPYRNPPPVYSPISPSQSLDSISLSSCSTVDDKPLAPPRQNRSNSRSNVLQEPLDKTSKNTLKSLENTEKGGLSVKERTQQFNRLASVEDELSPRIPKSAEKDRSKNWMPQTPEEWIAIEEGLSTSWKNKKCSLCISW
ncbi:uncharacterized protein LOC126739971 isoform X2 [Anthonomus grandis grandis]|uniref:uncharacterized protein LOC126739971 isoform X2 n=1 Tax=Anthonomus grandis grandis TaxID=2921223 RepID=UPI0021657BA2|nr:uncharacterized protein LOC126739971 isoform X2 [Anthonomus grandis grandis]